MSTGRTSLRTRMIAVALVAIVPAAVLTFAIQSRERRETRERALAENQQIVRAAAAQISDIFIGALRLDATLKRFPELTADSADCAAILGQVRDDHPGYLNIGIFDLDGSPLCTAAPLDPRTFHSVRERAWFRRAVESHAFALGDYQVGPSGRAAIVVAEPIGGSNGSPQRVLASSLSVDALDSIVDATKVPLGGVLILSDADGTVLAVATDGARSPSTSVGSRLDRAWLDPVSGMARQRADGGQDRMSVTERVETGSTQQPLYMTFSIGDDVVFAGADSNFRYDLSLLLAVSLLSIGVAAALGHVSVLRPVGAHAIETARELKESVDRYQQLFHQHPHPMWVFDRDTLEFLEVNDAAVHTYGYSRDEFRDMRLSDIRPAEEVPAFLARLREQQHAGWARSTGWRHRLKSGALIDVEVTSHPFTFAGRNAALVIAVDVTERLRAAAERNAAEQALRVAEERMRFALEAAGVGVWEANLAADEAYWSETCERMHGFAPGSFGRTFEAFLACLADEDRANVRQSIEKALRERDAEVQLQYTIVLPDGRARTIASVSHFTYDEHGVPTRGAGISMDLTDKRSLEQQLHQAQKMEAIGQLAGGIAHDFNNLLTAIQGYSELLAESFAPDDRRRADVEEIQRAGRRAAELTRQLLAFGRKQRLSPRVLHVGDVIGQLAPMLRRLLGESIELRTIVANRGHVKFDPGQLDQILMNLAVNASDAMDQQGILTIETADVAVDETAVRAHAGALAPGPHVMIAVSDTGCGMAAETLSHIFEPFFTTKPIDRGTGLGLAMVYGIMRQSGGSISVSSEIGTGTTFRLYLPRAEDAAANGAPPQAEPQPLERGIESILLIEDEAQVREYVARVLRSLGYRVTDIESPTAAVTYAREQAARIDLVLTDVVMPALSGPDAYEQIRATHPESSVLFMSGYAERAGTGDGILASRAAYLQKPFPPAVLARRVREALEHAPAI